MAAGKLPFQSDTAKQSITGNANLPAKYMGKDEPEAVHNAAEEALEGVVEKPGLSGLLGKQQTAIDVPNIDMDQLQQLMMAAKRKQGMLVRAQPPMLMR
jgi:hypothetical protein